MFELILHTGLHPVTVFPQQLQPATADLLLPARPRHKPYSIETKMDVNGEGLPQLVQK